MSHPIRILHVEDRVDDADLVRMTLAAGGMQTEALRVETATAFEAALQGGTFDLILSDFSLPSFSGEAALAQAQRLRPEIPFVFVSGTIGEENAVEMLKRGATDYVLKDRLARLAPAIERALKETADRQAKQRAESELGARDEYMRRVAEASPVVIAVLDLERDALVYVAGAVESVLGYTPEQLIAMGADFRPRLYHPDDLATAPSRIARFGSAPDGVVDFVLRIRHNDGGWRSLHTRATVFARRDDGAPTQLLTVFHDVTEKQRARQRRDTRYAVTRVLAENPSSATARAQILRALADGLGFAVAEWWEPAAAGLERADAWAAPGFDDSTFLTSTRGLVLNGKEGLPSDVWDAREPMCTPDLGRSESLYSTLASAAGLRGALCFPITSQGRRLAVVVCISRETLDADDDFELLVGSVGSQVGDFIERKRGEAALQLSDERFRLVTRATNDVVWDWDLATGGLWWNEAAETVLGYSPAAVGREHGWRAERIHPQDRERVLSQLKATVAGDATWWSGEYKFRRADGNYIAVIDRAFVLRDGAGVALRCIGSMVDMTERRQMEEQILRAQRMESLGTLAGGIAHDLNNVLAPILAAAQILKKRSVDERQQRLLTAIETSALRGADMVKQVLTFARGAEGERMLIQPRHIAREIEGMARQTFPRVIDIRSELPAELWTVSGDSTQVHQVLLNLCVNARDAMPQGGILWIKGENLTLDAHYAAMHPGAKAGDYVLLTVTDTGTGMPPGVIEKIFEPFFTTKEQGKGTGLGLSTTHSIVKSHGGFISVYSEPGRGTTFKVHLPAVGGGSVAAASGRCELATGKGETILLVDDEAGIRELTKETLETHGYKVLTAGDGAEAVALFAKQAESVALVLTDMNMPLMDGIATARALRSLSPALRVVISSGLASHGGGLERADLRDVGFIQKPFTAASLLTLLRQELDRTPATP